MNNYGYQGPKQFKPLSPWAYFGYTILFSLPIIGFIMLIIYSLNDSNINRRCFARSYWCVYIIAGIVIAALIATGALATIASTTNFFNKL